MLRVILCAISLMSLFKTTSPFSSSPPLPPLPGTPEQMISSAARSIKNARTAGLYRQTVTLIVPELASVGPGDLDPWPGGTRQMSREAQPLIEAMLKVVTGSDSVRSTIVDAESGSMQFIGEGNTPAEDVCVLSFADIESFDTLRMLDEACGKDRLMVLVNPQFTRASDFGLFARGKAKSYLGGADAVLTEKFPFSFCLQEQAVRSEDCKIVYNQGVGWGAYVMSGSTYEGMNMVEAGDAMPLHGEPEASKPTYKWVEERLNEKFPDPVFIRKLKEATDGRGPLSRNNKTRLKAKGRDDLGDEKEVEESPRSVVWVIEDDSSLLDATVQYLRENTDYEIVPFLNAEPCVKLLGGKTLPNCIISDIQIPDHMSGLDFLKFVRDNPVRNIRDLPFLLLTARGMTDDRITGYEMGANAYLPKPFSPQELKAILIGLVSRSSASSALPLDVDNEKDTKNVVESSSGATISIAPRESEVLKLLSEGCTNKEISSTMFISVRTVERYVTNLFKKTGTGRRTELVRWSLKNGLIDVDDRG